uniref:Nudix hydrolase domain-containing protein n=1 Tax=Cucumis melo TaxID=3656 RepID=A0A9I9CLY0_CUCME
MTHFLHPSSSLRSLGKGFLFPSSSSFLQSNSIALRSFSCQMSADSPIRTQSITIPCQLDQPIQILAAPGVSDSDFRNAIDSSLFKQWLMNLQSESGILTKGAMSLKRVLIQGVDMFGNKIGFLKFKADVYDKQTGKKVPGIVFARGPAVAVLILLSCEGETYAVLTEQFIGFIEIKVFAIVPVGKLMLELPAGMLDDDKGDFVGTAVREVEEEIGIQLRLEDMVDLTGFLDQSTGCRVFPSPFPAKENYIKEIKAGNADYNFQVPSPAYDTQTSLSLPSITEQVSSFPTHSIVTYPFCNNCVRLNTWRLITVLRKSSYKSHIQHNILGLAFRHRIFGGCDEGIGLFLYRGSASKETIAELQGKETGLRDHGELIKVHVVPYEKLWRVTADAKALMAIALYEMAQKEGLLPSLKP